MMTVEQYEQKGRNKLKADFDNAECEMMYEFTDTGNHIDCYATACTGEKYAIEIKNRDIPFDKYDTILLEWTKYDALMQEYALGYTPLFRCYFRDAVFTWDISKIDIEGRIEKMFCTKKTFENYGNRIEKEVIMLKKEEAIDQRRNNKHNC